MGIKYEHTPIALVGQLGKLAGQTTQLRREAEQRAQDIRQIRQIQHSEAMAEFQANLDLQAEQRARQWELEKAEINSQFKLQEQLKTESILGERDLRKRIERLDSSEKAAEAYDLQYGPRELLNPERQAEYDKDMKAIKMKGYGITLPTAPKPTRPSATQVEGLQYMGYTDEEIAEILGIPAPGAAPTTPTAPTVPTVGPFVGPITPPTGQPAIPTVRNDADYNALPSGSTFFDPEGQMRTKP